MLASGWTEMIPLVVTQLVTLVVAFGVWRLTSRHEISRWQFERRNEAYLQLYASNMSLANDTRDAFLDPTDVAAVARYNALSHTHAVDFARTLVLGSSDFVRTSQLEIRDAIALHERVMSQRQLSRTVWTVDEAGKQEVGQQFSDVRKKLHEARTHLLQLAVAEANRYLKTKSDD